LVRVGLLTQVVGWVALVVEPPTAALIDFRSRRALMAFGGGVLALSMLVMGFAHSFAWLLAAFALYGVGSGPLAQTADVLVIEMFPGMPERAYTWATCLDTVGALLGPAAVAGVALFGWSWRIVVVACAGIATTHAFASSTARFEPPPGAHHHGSRVVIEMARNVRRVLSSPRTRRPLIALLCFDLFESAFVLKFVWLHESVGLSLAGVAAWAAGEQVVDLVALSMLDRWVRRRPSERVLRSAATILVVLPAAWIAAPGVPGRVIVGIPLAAAHALVWPIVKSRSLVAEPSMAGSVQAVSTLFGLLPLAVLQGAAAQVLGMGPAMGVTAALGAGALAVATIQPNG
jgi:MFS family permease